MDQLQELKQRVQRAEERMASADSAIQRLGLRHTSRKASRAVGVMVALVFAAGVALLASPPPGETVHAPFRVVDDNNKVIFMVTEDHQFGLYRAGNQETPVLLGATAKGATAFEGLAEFRAQSEDQKTVAAIGVTHGDTPGLNLRYGGKEKSLNMFVISGKPQFSISNSGWAVAQLGEGERGAGRLLLTNAQGKIKVQAGTTASGVGAVSAFSDAPPGAGFLGLPGSFICGSGCSGK